MFSYHDTRVTKRCVLCHVIKRLITKFTIFVPFLANVLSLLGSDAGVDKSGS